MLICNAGIMELPDLQSLLQSQSAGTGNDSEIDLSILDGLALDVRLSAETATGAPFPMTDLAAAIIVNDGRASFDIGRADAIGGAVSGAITLQAQDGATAFSADLVGKNIELEQKQVLKLETPQNATSMVRYCYTYLYC